jgi:hypothetical protein
MDVVKASDQMIESKRSLPFRLGRLARVDDALDVWEEGGASSSLDGVPEEDVGDACLDRLDCLSAAGAIFSVSRLRNRALG